MLIKLNVIKQKDEMDLSERNKVSDTEKRRFNSSFEYYQTSGLTNENINNFVEIMSKNIKNVQIAKKDNKGYKLTDTLLEDREKMQEIKKEFKEVIIDIQEDETDNNFDELLLKLFETIKEPYTGTLDYSDLTGLVEKVHIQTEKN